MCDYVFRQIIWISARHSKKQKKNPNFKLYLRVKFSSQSYWQKMSTKFKKLNLKIIYH